MLHPPDPLGRPWRPGPTEGWPLAGSLCFFFVFFCSGANLGQTVKAVVNEAILGQKTHTSQANARPLHPMPAQMHQHLPQMQQVEMGALLQQCRCTATRRKCVWEETARLGFGPGKAQEESPYRYALRVGLYSKKTTKNISSGNLSCKRDQRWPPVKSYQYIGPKGPKSTPPLHPGGAWNPAWVPISGGAAAPPPALQPGRSAPRPRRARGAQGLHS